MSIKINTRFGEIVTSQALNEKIDTLFGENAIISGFDVTRETDTSVCIAPGKAIVCGASIEEDRDTTTINIDSNLLTKKDLFVVIHYIHDSKQARFKIVELLEANMVVLAKLTMLNSTISEIACAEKTGQLKELSSIAKDLETNLLDTQLLSVTGDEIKLQNSCPGKTANIKVKGKTKQNLVKTPNKEVLISGEMAIDEKCSHQINDSKAGCVDVVIKGRTLQNLAGEPIGLFGGATYENGKGVMSPESVGSNIKISNNLINSNSVYTVFMNVLKNTTVGESVKIEILGGSIAGKEYTNVPDGAIGQIKMIIDGLTTTNSKDYINIWKRPNYPGEFEFDSFMVFEGDWTNTPLEELPYIEGIAGVGDKSKNLLKKSQIKQSILSGLGGDSGNIIESNRPTACSFRGIKCKPNTTYVLKTNKTVNATLGSISKDNVGLGDTGWGECSDGIIYTTPSNAYELAANFRKDDSYGDIPVDYLRDSDIQLEEGPVATPYKEYYDGYKVQIKSNGKNLFDNEKIEKDKHYGYLGGGVSNTPGYDSYSASVVGLSQVTLINIHSNATFWDNQGRFISGIGATSSHTIIDVPYGAAEIRCAVISGSEAMCLAGNHSYDTPYEPYQGSKRSYILDEPLMRLPGGLCDEINADGELVRRVGKVVFDGSESGWSNDTTQDLELTKFFNIKISNKGNSGRQQHICDKFNYIGNAMATVGDIECIGSYTSDVRSINIRMLKSRLETKDVSGFKKWLSENPTTVYYELETPIITPLDMQVVLPNGVYDKVCDDGVERRIKKIILNGSEDWKYNNITASPDTILKFILDISDIKIDSIPKSDRFKSLKYVGGHQLNDEFVMSHLTNKEIAFSVKVSRLSSPDSNGFKQWLSENPTTVWYELEEPYKESYEYNKPRLSTYAEITYMSSDTKVMPKIKVDSKGEKYPALLKPSTKYTVSMVAKDGDANLDLDLGGTKVTIPKTQYETEITTPSTLAHDSLYVAGWNTKIKDVMILHGSDSNDYIDGITSVGSSPNLLSDYLKDKYIGADGQLYDSLNWCATDFIEVNPLTKYIQNFNIKTSSLAAVSLYDKNKSFIKSVNDNMFTTTADTKYIRTCWDYSIYGMRFHIQKGAAISKYQKPLGHYTTIIQSKGKNLISLKDIVFKRGGKAYLGNVRDNFIEVNNDSAESYAHMYGEFPEGLLEPNTTYVITYKFSSNRSDIQNIRAIRIYKNGNFNSVVSATSNTSLKFTTPSASEMSNLGIVFYANSADTSGISPTRNVYYDVQIEKTNVITPFQEYKINNSIIKLNEPLRSLPSGVCDEIVDGKLIRKVGEVVFDGSESWTLWRESSNTIGFIYKHDSIMNKDWYSSQTSLVCDRFISKSGHNFNENDSEAIAQWNANNTIFIRINKRALKTLDVSGFKQWLAENPVTVLYELSKPVITDITEDLNVRTYEDVTYISTVGPVKADLEFKTPMNLRAIINQTADRITEAEKLVDELLLPNIVEVDYERTLLEFDYEVSKFNLEGDE